MRKLLNAHILFGMILAASLSLEAQFASSNSMRLSKPGVLRRSVAAMPLIQNPTTAEQQINQSLRKIDVSMRSVLVECDRDYATLQIARDKNDGSKLGDWTRTITVTMAGPRYLSYLITDSNYCGGAHPDFSESALVYDLKTGLPVNWTALLPVGVSMLEPEGDWNSIPAQQIAAKSLQDFYARRLKDEECRKIMEKDDFSLLIWPDAKFHKLVLGANLPHVVEACAEHVELSLDEARQLGFSETFLKTIEIADKH